MNHELVWSLTLALAMIGVAIYKAFQHIQALYKLQQNIRIKLL